MTTPAGFEGLLAEVVRSVIREELATLSPAQQADLLTPEELAAKLKIPLTWVYEQSRQGNIPTRRIGRYIRFDFDEVLQSEKAKEKISS
jgi:excisionase family DNA binding protein